MTAPVPGIPVALQPYIADEHPAPHHLIPQSSQELRELATEKAADKVQDTVFDHVIKEPLLEGAKELGHVLAEQGGELAGRGVGSGEAISLLGRAVGAGTELYEGGTALLSAVTTGVGAGVALGVAEWKAVDFIDSHTNHALRNNPVALAGQGLVEKTGLPERMDYATSVRQEYEIAHPEGSRADFAKVMARAAVGSGVLDNHAESLQQAFNDALKVHGHADQHITLDEARSLVPALQDSHHGDAIVLSGPYILYESGPVRPPLAVGEVAVDAQYLRDSMLNYHSQNGTRRQGDVAEMAQGGSTQPIAREMTR